MDPGWNDRAIDLLRDYVRELGCDEKGPRRFLTENFVTWLGDRRERCPQEGRAFGAVMQRAAREGIVVKAGFGYATSSNGSPKILWRAA